MAVTLFSCELGEGRVLSIIKDEAEYFIDLRIVENDDQPSRKGQRLSLSRWKNLINNIEDIEKEVESMKNKEDVDYRLHLGGNICFN